MNNLAAEPQDFRKMNNAPEQFNFSQPERKNNIENKEKINSKENLLEKIDALIVLGNIWKPSADTKKERGHHLSIESKMRTLAAGEMFRVGLIKKIIFSGGKTAGKKWSSEAESMAKYLKKKFPEIPDEIIIIEQESFTTLENVEKVKEILEKYGINKIAFITNGFHLKRSQIIFENEGLKAQGFITEEFLQKRTSVIRDSKSQMSNYKKFIEKYLGSKTQKWNNIKEAILRNLLVVDTKERIPKTISFITRKKYDK